ncbi:hypothetical protein KI659_14770 [Litoribacter alkaliphilus]|uniref:Uncharacterized protein n=1 Tax=Litoribacter ruber TaxID=702568 RepID=A0AAP2CK84_9BACT|nr:hypothetical protein [Litoribacter alkaliphilus]MBS9525279.1 hypothetical protein [Litoribacter alkaliphilus]
MAIENKLPVKAVEYLKENFRKEFIFDLKGTRKIEGETFYQVEVSKDGLIHQLTFNQSGQKISEIADDAFPSEEGNAESNPEILD